MRGRSIAAILAASLLLFARSADSQTTGFGLDLRVGVTSGSESLGSFTGVPDGYFGLGELTPAPGFGLGVLFPEVVLGIRPQALISYAIPADVRGNWIPCDPGFACPSILLPIDARADRLEATVGAELPVLAQAGPVRPYATAGIGLRRYGFSWSAVGRPGDPLNLAPGSVGETDFLVRLGVGVGVRMGRYEALLEGTADLSEFGAGRVPVPTESLILWPEPFIDLGRESQREYAVVVGLRRYLD